jgi:hypothetical protein
MYWCSLSNYLTNYSITVLITKLISFLVKLEKIGIDISDW